MWLNSSANLSIASAGNQIGNIMPSSPFPFLAEQKYEVPKKPPAWAIPPYTASPQPKSTSLKFKRAIYDTIQDLTVVNKHRPFITRRSVTDCRYSSVISPFTLYINSTAYPNGFLQSFPAVVTAAGYATTLP
ncbi:hypothetical protein V8G54_031644 [Vigna mungo]|uniref:Uncharacterized protein n=1 Tax=Vigna mungo TaxID=3915 RepID=A0AAQ3MKD9_VIGMU